MAAGIGVRLQHSYIGEKSSNFTKISEHYEPLLNITRALKSFTDFTIKFPSYLNPFLKTLAENFKHYIANVDFHVDKIDLSILDNLKPVSKFLGAGRDFLTFLELPVRIKKVCDANAWNPTKTNRMKLIGMIVQVFQKILESFFLIPSTFGIYDLAKYCTMVGNFTGMTFLTATFVFGLKEVTVLVASTFGAISYQMEVWKGQARLNKKLERKVQLEPVMDNSKTVRQVAADFINDANIAKRREGQRATLDDLKGRIKHFKDEKTALAKKKQEAFDAFNKVKTEYNQYADSWFSLKRYSLKIQKNAAKKELKICEAGVKKKEDDHAAACNRYIRRYFLEGDLKNKDYYPRPLVDQTPSKSTLDVGPDVPDDVKSKIHNILTVVPNREERIEKILKHKYLKTVVQCHNTDIQTKRASYSRNFDLSKILIVSLSLLAITGATATALLAPYAAAIGVATWFAVGIIGYTGFSKTWFLAFDYKEWTLPKPENVFLDSLAIKA